MRKFLISISAMLSFIFLVFAGFQIFAVKTPARYTETYYGELTEKTKRLESIQDKKIVFVGGSSISFGIRSSQLEKELGMPVVSYGLYASLGTKVMMDLSLHGIGEGDIVILAPEINEETYSTYMGYENILKCLENNHYSKYLSFSDREELLYKYPKFIIEKRTMDTPEPEKPYTKDSFNSYGDIIPELVVNNIQPKLFDSSQMVKPNTEMLNDEFINMVNVYNKKITKKKATLYFSFSPTNALALDKTDLASFEAKLSKDLDCKVLGSILDFTYNELYFYDTNFHLNQVGSILHTKTYAELLAKSENMEIKEDIIVPEAPKALFSDDEEELPDDPVIIDPDTPGDEPEDPVNPVDENHMNINGVLYEKSQTGWTLVGTDTEGKKLTKIEIPDTINDLKVIMIEDNAFSDCVLLEELVIASNISFIGANCFKNCPNLISIYLNASSPPMIPSEGLLDGCNENVKIYIPKNKMRSYTSGYTWVDYKKYFVSV